MANCWSPYQVYQVNSESFEHDETLGENFEEEEEEERLDQGARQRVSYQLENYDCLRIMTLWKLWPFASDDPLQMMIKYYYYLQKRRFAKHHYLQTTPYCRTATSDQVAWRAARQAGRLGARTAWPAMARCSESLSSSWILSPLPSLSSSYHVSTTSLANDGEVQT